MLVVAAPAARADGICAIDDELPTGDPLTLIGETYTNAEVELRTLHAERYPASPDHLNIWPDLPRWYPNVDPSQIRVHNWSCYAYVLRDPTPHYEATFLIEASAPDVRGLTAGEANALLAQRGLWMARSDPDAPEDWLVRAQDVDPDAVLAWNDGLTDIEPTITVTLEQPVTVPDVVRQGPEQARADLIALGLAEGERHIPLGDPGTVVVRQDPAPGSQVLSGTPVELWLDLVVSPTTSPTQRSTPPTVAVRQIDPPLTTAVTGGQQSITSTASTFSDAAVNPPSGDLISPAEQDPLLTAEDAGHANTPRRLVMTVPSAVMSNRGADSDSLGELLFGRDRPLSGGGRRAHAFAARVGRLPLTDRGGLSSVAGQLLGSQLTVVAKTLLDLDLGELFLTAWRAHAALREAARATLAEQGTEQVVDLATHRIQSIHRPYVDVLVNGVAQMRIEFVLTLELAVAQLAVVVSGGRLIRVESGRSTLTAGLCIGGVEVLRRQRRMNLGVVLRLGAGVAILSPQEAG